MARRSRELEPPTENPAYEHPAAGFPGVYHALKYAAATSGVLRGTKALLRLNQVKGFDCPSCAWPEPNDRSMTEFCENGARAAVHEGDRRRADAAFSARTPSPSSRRRATTGSSSKGASSRRS